MVAITLEERIKRADEAVAKAQAKKEELLKKASGMAEMGTLEDKASFNNTLKHENGYGFTYAQAIAMLKGAQAQIGDTTNPTVVAQRDKLEVAGQEILAAHRPAPRLPKMVNATAESDAGSNGNSAGGFASGAAPGPAPAPGGGFSAH
ncbi:hypothetical protein A4U49_13130 [Acidithiobacillus ferrivorans]|uniref:hypothetical protein n=1 Tax=Acidithiobacillus ferrivorans TaxID=160808 RepID=UPI0008932C7D|nr:hypothetical protein [Acidithiobacillus ferrivorans]OFA15391.1 hypothetical protein A4U49_13130 [Acidithiobacillus ferrivorans]